LDPAGPTWSLAQASDPVGQQTRVAQTTCALHSAKVIKLPSHCFLLLQQICRNKEKRKTLPGDDESEGDSNNSSTLGEFSLLPFPFDFSSLFSVWSLLTLLFVCLLIGSPLFSLLLFFCCPPPFLLSIAGVFTGTNLPLPPADVSPPDKHGLRDKHILRESVSAGTRT